MGFRIGEHAFHRTIPIDAQDLAGFVATDVEPLVGTERYAVRNHPRERRDRFTRARRTVLENRDAENAMTKAFGHVEKIAVRRERYTVGEIDRLAIPHRPRPVRIEPHDSWPRVMPAVTVRNIDLALGVNDGMVWHAHSVAGHRVGKTSNFSCARFDVEDRRMLKVAYVQIVVGIEYEAKAEASRRSDLLQSRPVGRQAIDLTSLATTPHAAVAMHGHALGVVKSRLGDGAVVEDPSVTGPDEGVCHLHCGT